MDNDGEKHTSFNDKTFPEQYPERDSSDRRMQYAETVNQTTYNRVL
ncbi:hypothetical protein ACR1PO_03295 [Chryseobacterium sp. RRHN12]